MGEEVFIYFWNPCVNISKCFDVCILHCGRNTAFMGLVQGWFLCKRQFMSLVMKPEENTKV